MRAIVDATWRGVQSGAGSRTSRREDVGTAAEDSDQTDAGNARTDEWRDRESKLLIN